MRGRRDGAHVVGEHVRIAQPVEEQFAVRLVTDQEYLPAQLGLLGADDLAHPGQQLGGVDHARGVVGRVDEHDAGLIVEARLERGEVGQKVVVRRHHPAGPAVVVGVVVVLNEVGGEDDHLVARVQQGLEHHVHRAARAHGHQRVVGGEVQPRLLAQLGGHRRAGVRIAGVGHVAVHSRRRVVGDAAQLVEELARRLDDGVAERQVEHVLVAVHLTQGDAVLEHLANPRPLLHELANLLGYRHCRPLGEIGRGAPG